ncbi:MAG: hypothetical protein CMJ85_09920 [Planctomycetes bacterium]|nr:hypothetical protein [Planctomycetota bacterium]
MADHKLPRRDFFRRGLLKVAQAASDALAAAGKELQARTARTRPNRAPGLHRSRPPGAVAGREFLTLCTKCNDCVTACPAWAIRVAGDNEAEPGYPMLEPSLAACAVCEDPVPCIAACETGALVSTPRESIRLGLAVLDVDRCVVPRGEECDFCVSYCPVPEQAIRMSEAGPLIVDWGCVGCGMCAVMCPEEALSIGDTAS